jgi:hypothetical protein
VARVARSRNCLNWLHPKLRSEKAGFNCSIICLTGRGADVHAALVECADGAAQQLKRAVESTHVFGRAHAFGQQVLVGDVFVAVAPH